MKLTQRSREGYLLIDHRDSPGLDHPQLGPGSFYESPTRNCSHCERLIVLNPKRTRSRGYCPKCDSYVCDWCEAKRVSTGICYSMKQRIDEFMDQAAKGVANG